MTPGYALARTLTAPPGARSFPLRIVATSGRTITLEADATTTEPGEWGLFLESGGHVRLGGPPQHDGDRVSWRVIGDSALPQAGERASWTGIVAPNPAAAGLRGVDHLFSTRAGTVPAWYIDAAPGEKRDLWAVHVHGLGSSRAGTLRGANVAYSVGLPSIVPAYRNTTEGPRVGNGRSHLGATEADDIADVLEQASVTGRERFILFGWSMGAQIALSLATSDRWGPRIDRVILDSPVLDWRSVIAANLRRNGLPSSGGRLAESWLQSPMKARMVGLDRPVYLDSMDWARRAASVSQPVLIHHGSADWSAPLASSEEFAMAAPAAELVTSTGGHTTGWNTDPVGWRNATTAFLRGA